MENYEQKKLGGGILTVSIIELIFSGFAIIGLLISIVMKDTIQAQLKAMGQSIPEIPTSQLIISIALSIILAIGIVLILLKKAMGIYIYFTCVIVQFIYSIIMNGFKFSNLISLVLPVLMAIFISKKKELFGFKPKSENVTI